jgi:hypothetical protein
MIYNPHAGGMRKEGRKVAFIKEALKAQGD